MPAPSSSLSTLRPDLSASLMEFDLEADRNGYIGLQVLPVIEVDRQSGNFGQIPIAQLLQARSTVRAPGAGYPRGNWTFTPQTYSCTEQGAEEPIDDRESEMYRDYFSAELIAAMRARHVVLMEHETAVATLMQDTTAISHTAVSNAWTGGEASSATPIDDVETAVQAVWSACGLWPNALIIERHAFRNLRNLGQIVDRLKYSGLYDPTAKALTTSVLSQVFDLPYVFVAGGTKNSANEGQAASLGSIWDKTKAIVARIPVTEDFKEPGFGRCFHWGSDGSSIGGTIETYRDEPRRSNIVRCRHDVHRKVLMAQCAYILTGVQ